MKLLKVIPLLLLAITCVSTKYSHKKNKLRSKQVYSTPFSVHHPNQAVVSAHRIANSGLGSGPSTVEFSNSNTSNSPQIGGFGRTAEIVNPHIRMHNREYHHMVASAPAHIGYRTDRTEHTMTDRLTGHTETHHVENKVPIFGNVEQSIPVVYDHARNYDLKERKFGPITHNVDFGSIN